MADIAITDRGAVDAAYPTFGVPVVGVFDLRLITPDVDDLQLDGAPVIFPRAFPVTDQIALMIDALRSRRDLAALRNGRDRRHRSAEPCRRPEREA